MFETGVFHCDGNLDGEKAEEGGEFNDGIERNGRSVFEWVAYGIAHDGRRVKRSVFRAEVDFNDLLGVVPCTAGVRHENGLEKSEERYADEVSNEEIRIEERKGEREAEDYDEDVDHSLLRLLGSDTHDLFPVLDRRRGGIELHVFFDVHDGSVGAGDNGLGACASEPITDTPTHQKTEERLGMNQRKLFDDPAVDAVEEENDTEHHCRGADHGGADENLFGRCFKNVAGTVALLALKLGVFEGGLRTET